MSGNVKVHGPDGITSNTAFTEMCVNTDGYINVRQYEPLVNKDFSRISEISGDYFLNKGQLNKNRLFPSVINEHCESSRLLQSTVTATNVVGQIFKASSDNIASIALTLESAGATSFDNFESYASSAALQASWVLTGTNLATLETTIVKNGSQSMHLPGDLAGDLWTKTIAATDYTNYSFNFNFYATKEFPKFSVRFFIGDGTNTKSSTIPYNIKKLWSNFSFSELSLTEDGLGVTNVAAITKIGFSIVAGKGGISAYIDDFNIFPPPGSLEVKLWDMGATKPVSGTTTISSGTQYTTLGDGPSTSIFVSLQGGKRIYHLEEFTAGLDNALPSNQLLTANNYYIIELKYVDTNVNVYGPDTSFATDYYVSGYAFSAPDEVTAITSLGTYADLAFIVFSRQDVYLLEATWRFDATPGVDSSMTVFVENSSMQIADMLTFDEHMPSQSIEEGLGARPIFVPSGSKVEFYYNDDYSDSTTFMVNEIKFLYKPPTVNG